MAPCKKKYTAEFFKKDRKLSAPDITNVSREEGSEVPRNDDIAMKFINEDRLISKLYREVVDEIMSKNKLRDSNVNAAIKEMKLEILQGHKRGFRRFRGINFSKPANCCGYLRRYAICHTGLVKQLMWTFFVDDNTTFFSEIAKKEIAEQNHLKVVSLGGGPGNDLVGFCCALQEISNAVKVLDLYIVDIDKGWMNVFPKILKKACQAQFGSLSQCLKERKINLGFMEADLIMDGIFKNGPLSPTLGEADLILMVKLVSFLPNEEAGDLIHNVVDCMKSGAMLIFIDQPYDEDFFREIKNLDFIYRHQLKYKLSFKPAKDGSPSIDSAQAHIGIYEKNSSAG